VKVGLFLALYSDRTLEEALDAAVAAGCEAVELVSTAQSSHCRPAALLRDMIRKWPQRRSGDCA